MGKLTFKKIKIALLGSYTLNNVQESLLTQLKENNLIPEIKLGGYNQFMEELIDPNSWLCKFSPDIILIAISSRTFLNNLQYQSNEDRKLIVKRKITSLIQVLQSNSLKSKIILTTLDYPTYSPNNLQDLTSNESINGLIASFNNELIRFGKLSNQISLLNFERLCSLHGKLNVFDEKMFYLGKILLTKKGVNVFSKEIANIIFAIYGMTKKCLIIDLDNTLWGGVIGEDGQDKLQLGEDTIIGRIYSEIQKIILNWKNSGVLLAIVSKNNLHDALQAFKNKNMILKEEDFIVKKVNWEEKSKNIEEIAKELNLGLDSFVFLDDNPLERLEVKSRMPEVSIIDFPEDISLLPLVLKQNNLFNSLNLTEEDRKRNKFYKQDINRNVLRKKTSLENYLKKLEIKIAIKKDDITQIERITQLINKTNQFNLRTKRYSIEDLKKMINSDDYIISSLSVKDAYGESGLTGVIIIKKLEDSYFVDSFLMSCRILSRKIEFQFFKETLKFLSNKNYKLITEYIPTPKNILVENFYDELGLKGISKKNTKKYSISLDKLNIPDIQWIKIIKNG
ncbi:MAG: HAD-IIIC family phosphatase [Nanoarchaeota archaeon]|nr:HAD-IIIC family phosphatase [Nanoarchaeota archaeon]